MRPKQIPLSDTPTWYKDAIIYQLHVKTFLDTNGNGIGDFKGLIKKLDYLQDLGVTVIWLLPFYPSPLKDDGYDISDYFEVHPDYGTLQDFKEFLKSAHYRGIRVITELVLNHTSDQHRWFQRARRSSPGSPLRDYYVWSDSTQPYQDARIIFKDFESSNWSWDSLAGAYYWHRFYSHQPDLNFDHPEVHKSLFKVIDFWLAMGVDGLRLDAVPYLYEREGTNCENLPETHDFLKKLRNYVESNYPNRLLLAEANQWPEDAVDYFGQGDECQMAFHFPIMPRLFMSLWMEDRFPIIDILEQTPEIPKNCQWAMFLRNHDELTLEMVTDEERDYMYRIYAQDPKARINLGIRRRLAPLLDNNRRKLELLNFLLFSLPGTPIIYYGDEIGMGDNYYLGDRNGVRTPMQWSPDRNAGFSCTNPQHLYLPVIHDPEYHYEVLNVENQAKNFSSLLWWMRRVIAMRKKFSAFGRGSIEFLFPENPKVLAFIRQYEQEIILVVINLSRFAQSVELNLSRYAGYVPVEVFSGNRFPIIKEDPYLFTLGIHDYFWFILKDEQEFNISLEDRSIPKLRQQNNWENVLKGLDLENLETKVLPKYLRSCRWFRSKTQIIRQIETIEDIALETEGKQHHLLILEISYTEGTNEQYVLPVSFLSKEESQQLEKEIPQAILGQIKVKEKSGYLLDALHLDLFRNRIFNLILNQEKITGKKGSIWAKCSKELKKTPERKSKNIASQVLKAEQSNTSILYNNTYFLKFYRKIEQGINPDTEIIIHLTQKQNFQNIAPFQGQVEYSQEGAQPITIGILQDYIPNQGDAWNFALDNLEHYFERILATKSEHPELPELSSDFFLNTLQGPPDMLKDLIGGYFLEMIRYLGEITADLHLALTQEEDDPSFVPEPFSKLYQRSLFQSMRSLTRRNIFSLQKQLDKLPEEAQDKARAVLEQEAQILGYLQKINQKKLKAQKIRVHGDYHLGQVLYTGNNFIIVDFEGEPARPLSERRLKRSCFKDVAGMIRSFHYAAYSALLKQASIRPEDVTYLKPWLHPWYMGTASSFLKGYLDRTTGSELIPESKEDQELLLNVFILEKAVYELGYEMNNRPAWLQIPIMGIQEILEKEAG